MKLKNKKLKYSRTRPNLVIANLIKRSLIDGSSRLSEPLKNNNVSILKVLDAIKNQECVKVINYKPDKNNKNLKLISLGPSYLEQQISRAIDKIITSGLLPQTHINYIKKEIGLLAEEISRLPNCTINIDLPTLRQSEENSCGATVIQMILAYYGQNIREQSLINKLKPGKSGSKMSEIQEIANKRGLKTLRTILDHDNIRKSLKNKLPVIIAIEKSHGQHFVIIIGTYADGYVLKDPSKFNNTFINKEEFDEKCYKVDDKFLALIIHSNKKPEYSSNKVEHYET